MTQIDLKSTLMLIVFSVFNTPVFAAFEKLTDFGDNPGELTATYYKKAHSFDPKEGHPLVVLLHGCTQNAEQLAIQSGFFAQAKALNFTLLLPQQNEKNHNKLCFNWYSQNDYAKNSGENFSLKNMIISAKKQFNASRIYVVGLSAGGAMTTALLINYPELFNSGAIIAGIPFACANDLSQALTCMQNGPEPTNGALLDPVRLPNNNLKIWPSLSIWTGTKDKIVNPVNAEKIASQWLHLFSNKPLVEKEYNETGLKITSWQDKLHKTKVELVKIENMGHGLPVKPALSGGGTTAPYLLNAPVSAAIRIVQFWQLSKS